MTELNRQSEENEESIIEIEIERLRPFKEHPFQVKDEMLQELPGAGQFIIVMDTWFERLMADQ